MHLRSRSHVQAPKVLHVHVSFSEKVRQWKKRLVHWKCAGVAAMIHVTSVLLFFPLIFTPLYVTLRHWDIECVSFSQVFQDTIPQSIAKPIRFCVAIAFEICILFRAVCIKLFSCTQPWAACTSSYNIFSVAILHPMDDFLWRFVSRHSLSFHVCKVFRVRFFQDARCVAKNIRWDNCSAYATMFWATSYVS